MDNVILYQEPSTENNERQRRLALLEKILGALAAAFRTELTRATATLYLGALLEANISADLLKRATATGLQEWRFFPTLAEILDVVRKLQSDPIANREAYAKLRKRYVEQSPEVKMLRSVLDETPAGLVPVERVRRLEGILSREQQIALGIIEPRAVHVPSRLAELRAQAERLKQQESTTRNPYPADMVGLS